MLSLTQNVQKVPGQVNSRTTTGDLHYFLLYVFVWGTLNIIVITPLLGNVPGSNRGEVHNDSEALI